MCEHDVIKIIFIHTHIIIGEVHVVGCNILYT